KKHDYRAQKPVRELLLLFAWGWRNKGGEESPDREAEQIPLPAAHLEPELSPGDHRNNRPGQSDQAGQSWQRKQDRAMRVYFPRAQELQADEKGERIRRAKKCQHQTECKLRGKNKLIQTDRRGEYRREKEKRSERDQGHGPAASHGAHTILPVG